MAISLEVMGSRMAENRRFYWMKLPNDYFRQLLQRKMRKQTGGIEMQLIYLKMLLYSIDKDAVIPFQGVYDSIEEELAEELGEESEMVKETINFLEANQRLERTEKGIFLPEALERVGSEGTSAERMRNMRRRRASQCDSSVTASDGNVTECNTSVQSGDVEKEIDIEKDKEVEKEKKKKVAASAYVDDPELNTAICDFVEHRKKLRKPMTDKAIALFVRHLQEITNNVQDQIDLINTAIERGWQTVYPSKGEQKQASGRQQAMSADDCLQGIINGDIKLEGGDFF